MCTPRSAHVTPLLCELHWLSICFSVKLKVLVITFKAPHGMGPNYLRDHLSPIAWIPCHQVRQEGHTIGPISQGSSLGKTQDEGFFCYGTSPLEYHSFEVRLAPIQLIFWKSLKTWFCYWPWESHESVEPVKWHCALCISLDQGWRTFF